MELKSHFLIPARLEGQAGWAGLSDLWGGWSGREARPNWAAQPLEEHPEPQRASFQLLLG